MSEPVVPPGPAPAASGRTRFRWVAVRALAERHRPHMLTHLLALGERDRYLRFGQIASDLQIARYVARIDFERDEVFGIFNHRLDVVALAHLALAGPNAEFGVSVLPQVRGRGFGGRLFERALLLARNRGVGTLVIHALSENTAMLRIVRRAGARIDHDGGDTVSRLSLPGEDFASRLEALAKRQAAELDYGLKRQARQIGAFWRRLRPAHPRTGDAPDTQARDPAQDTAV